MGMNKFALQFCILMFLIVVDVKALSLTSCNDQLENEVCEITCTTTDHTQNVAFSKLPDTGNVLGQCAPGVGCIGTGHYNITQPSSVSTVLSFVHSRQEAGEWNCDYGLNAVAVSVSWATYAQNVSTTMTSNTLVSTDRHVNATLECLHSAQNPTVTLQYENSNGNIDATSQTFECADTPVACTDVDFTTYACPVIIRAESGINNSDTYSIQLKTNVSNVQTEDVKTIATGITFEPPSTTSGSGDTSTPTGNSSGNTSTPTGNGSGDTSTPTGNRSGGTSTSTSNKGIVFVMLFVFLLANYSMVDAVCFCTRSTANKFKNKLFDCCGSKSSLESEDDPGFFKDKVLTLNASETSRSQSLIKNGTVTPHETQQPDGHEGPQSTPKDPDARHLTTGRPLPRRPDIASPQTGPFDSVNSPRPIVLAPIKNPNIPPSIDTLDEQKAER